MAIYSFSPFGFEGALVTVETDLRRGIPAFDIVGIADGCVKESRERAKAAIRNQGFELPNERILVSLSPCDIKKEGAGFDLPMALSILAQKDDYPRSQDAKVLVMGELELSGKIRPTRAVYPALSTASSAGIKYAIVPKGSETAIPSGIHVEYVENLREAYDTLCRIDENNVYGEAPEGDKETEMKVEFDEIPKDNLDTIKGNNGLKYAMAVAVAGRHNLLAFGKPGCGKTMILQRMPELLPKLTAEEKQSVTRIHSIAGLMEPNENFKETRPFRIPHPTSSIEGICGGGPNCRPGEISLAHNGVLFLDEAAEFRSSVLQMMRVPLECNTITLSRAGRTTVYPANFQLVMATNPCPCGNYGSNDKVCLCSAKSVEMYWQKFSAPLLDRIEIRFNAEEEDGEWKEHTVEELRTLISNAWYRQYARQGKLNRELKPEEVEKYIKNTADKDAIDILERIEERNELSQRAVANILKVAQTVADMENLANVDKYSMTVALELRGKLPLDNL